MAEVGLGFKQEIINYFLEDQVTPDFIELAPEHWMNNGALWRRQLRDLAQRFAISCHGLSFPLGSAEALDFKLLQQLKSFIEQSKVQLVSEHLSFSKSSNAHLYNVLPLPFTEEAINHAIKRIGTIQDFLGRKIAIENIVYYTPVASEMSEAAFITAVSEESNCDILLDINSVYVNSVNHGYDAREFINALPAERISYIHVSGHERQGGDFIINSHGSPVSENLYQLLDWALDVVGIVPVVLEREFNFPASAELNAELNTLRLIINQKEDRRRAA